MSWKPISHVRPLLHEYIAFFLLKDGRPPSSMSKVSPLWPSRPMGSRGLLHPGKAVGHRDVGLRSHQSRGTSDKWQWQMTKMASGGLWSQVMTEAADGSRDLSVQGNQSVTEIVFHDGSSTGKTVDRDGVWSDHLKLGKLADDWGGWPWSHKSRESNPCPRWRVLIASVQGKEWMRDL